MFDMDEFIIAVYLCIDSCFQSLLALYPPRRRGVAPQWSDAEVLTIEIVREFMGHHQDVSIWRYFHRHWHR
jgi:hypothetical protein